MTKREKSEWRNWWGFCGRRLREFLFLAMWASLGWALNEYIVHPFPMSGAPKYMLYAFEGLFNISTLIELALLLFWPYQSRALRLLSKRRNA
jgi:hypothetical protein